MLDKKSSTSPETPGWNPPNWRDPETARADLKVILREFLKKHVGAAPVEGEAPALGLKVSAGLGKTRATLEAIAELGAGYLKSGHILFYVPTHALAEEAAEIFRNLPGGADLPSLVLRGRSAINPSTGMPMCQRWELAEELSGKVDSITQMLCKTEQESGMITEAPCAQGCPYLAQSEIWKKHVIFLPHSYLTLKIPVEGPVALRIIDEKFWGSLIEHVSIPIGDWERRPWFDGLDQKDHDSPDGQSRLARRTVLEALTANEPIPDALSEKDFDGNKLEELARIERQRLAPPEIKPTMDDRSISRQIEKNMGSWNDVAFRDAAIFDLLAKTAGQPNTERLHLSVEPRKKKNKNEEPTERVLNAHYLKELRQDCPYILLDADLDETITRQFFHQPEVKELQCRPQAEVVQIKKNTFSDTWLLAKGEKGREDPELATKRCKDVLSIIEREGVRAEGKVLVVATKKVLRKLYHVNQTSRDELPRDLNEDEDSYKISAALRGLKTDPIKLPPLKGADVRWFGPRMLGVNDFEDHSTIVVVGRLQPPVNAIENDTRALFGDGDRPLQFVEEARLDNKMIPGADGVCWKVQVHPDPRAQAVLQQTREAGSEQAIARLRLIDPKGKKKVLILSDLPLPTLPADRRVSLAQLMGHPELLEPMPDLDKLQRALKRPDGTLLRGIRTSPTCLHEDAPHVFRDREQAKTYLKHFGKRQPEQKNRLIRALRYLAAQHAMEATEVVLAHNRGGRSPVSAMVFADSRQTRQKAAALWPEYRVNSIVPESYSDQVIDENNDS